MPLGLLLSVAVAGCDPGPGGAENAGAHPLGGRRSPEAPSAQTPEERPTAAAASPTPGVAPADRENGIDWSRIWADPHLHANGCNGALESVDIVARLIGRGLQVGSALVWGVPESWSTDRARFTGEDDPASVARAILHYDLEISEFPAGSMGHLTLLGLRSLNFARMPHAGPLSGIPIARWARAQGSRSLIGMSHAQSWPDGGRIPSPGMFGLAPIEFPIHVVLSRNTFLEFEGPNLGGGLELWKALQNSGFRVAVVGASDFPCALDIGDTRTRVLIDGPVSYAAYLDAIRAGRTVYVDGNGGWLDLTVNGARLGAELAVSHGAEVVLKVDSDLAAGGSVTVLVNGQAVENLDVGPGPDSFTRRMTIDSSSWIAVQSAGIVTSAIYVIADGRPIRASADDACFLWRHVDNLIRLMQSGSLDFGPDQQQTMAAYTTARSTFNDRFVEAGGTTCP